MENKYTGMNNLDKLSYELTYHKYLVSMDKIHKLFSEVSVAEYITLHDIAKLTDGQEDITKQKTYLKELSEVLRLPIRSVSKLVGRLRDKDLVLWSHDGIGEEGTYVSITEHGLMIMEKQGEILKNYYGEVIARFGREKMITLLKLADEFEEVANSVFSEISEK